jgi:hypothetical protein
LSKYTALSDSNISSFADRSNINLPSSPLIIVPMPNSRASQRQGNSERIIASVAYSISPSCLQNPEQRRFIQTVICYSLPRVVGWRTLRLECDIKDMAAVPHRLPSEGALWLLNVSQGAASHVKPRVIGGQGCETRWFFNEELR